MGKSKQIAEWALANKDWLYPVASGVVGWCVRHFWPAKPCANCAPTSAPASTSTQA